jgi:putative FmdB family regulatory protein
MPVYDYVCKKCGEVQEKVHKMEEENKEKCEFCEADAEQLKKILSPFPRHVSWSKWNVGQG